VYLCCVWRCIRSSEEEAAAAADDNGDNNDNDDDDDDAHQDVSADGNTYQCQPLSLTPVLIQSQAADDVTVANDNVHAPDATPCDASSSSSVSL